jgi:serine/threonine protein kinase
VAHTEKPEAIALPTTKIPMPVLEVLARGSGRLQPQLLDDRYELRGAIGGGGMADVFEAHDHELDRDVAIKILRRGPTTDVADVARFRREAQVLANVHSPRLVEIYDARIAPDACYIVLRLVVGPTARKLIEAEGPLGARAAVAVVLDVLTALSALHAADVVHRDIKPSNVIIGDDGRATLLDLGVAQDRRRGDLTAYHQTVGTPSFMSPELRKSARVDARSDLYQAATLLRFLATGIEPSCDHVDLAGRVPAELARVIERGMAEHALRYHSAEAMADALLVAIGERASTPAAPNRLARPANHRVTRLAIAACAMAALACLPSVAASTTTTALAIAPSAEIVEPSVPPITERAFEPRVVARDVAPAASSPAPAVDDATAMPVIYQALADDSNGDREAAITGYFSFLTMVSRGPAADIARAHLAALLAKH